MELAMPNSPLVPIVAEIITEFIHFEPEAGIYNGS